MTRINSSRINWVDSMKAFSIMAVVLFHTQIRPEIKTATYLVCLPAFFFVAGLFTNTQLSPKAFFLKKTVRLLIPYIIWGLLAWVFWFFVSSRFGNSIENDIAWWRPILGLIFGKVDMLCQNVPLWFLCCMISLEWIYFIVCQFRQQWLRWLLIIMLCVTGCILSYLKQNWVWEISSAFIILPIYAIGAEFSLFFKTKAEQISTSILISLLVFSLIGLGVGYTYNNTIRLSVSFIGNPILYYVTALSAVGIWLSISLIIRNYDCWATHLLQYIGQNTLFILCTHVPTFSIIKGIAFICAIPLQFFETTIGCLVLWTCTFIILLPLAYLVNRYCPILVGKTQTTNGLKRFY